MRKKRRFKNWLEKEDFQKTNRFSSKKKRLSQKSSASFFCKSKISEGHHISETLHSVDLVDFQLFIIFRHDNAKKNILQILQSQTGYVVAFKPGRDGSGQSSCQGCGSGDRPGRYPSVD